MRGIYSHKEKHLSHSKLGDNPVLHLSGRGVVTKWSKILIQSNVNLLCLLHKQFNISVSLSNFVSRPLRVAITIRKIISKMSYYVILKRSVICINPTQ